MHSKQEAESLKSRIQLQTPYVTPKVVGIPDEPGGPAAMFAVGLVLAPERIEYVFANNGVWWLTKDFTSAQAINKHQFETELCQMIAFWAANSQLDYARSMVANQTESEPTVKRTLIDEAQKNAVVSFRFLESQSKDNNLHRKTRRICADLAQQVFEATLLMPNL
jgi:hypothetical protein